MKREDNIIHGPEPIVPTSNETIGKQLLKNLLTYQNIPEAMIDAVTEESISYYTILEKSVRIAKCFKRFDFEQNKVIGIYSENCLEYFLPIIAAMYEGIAVTTFNSNYTLREVLHCAKISLPQLVFCSKQTLTRTLELQHKLKCIKYVIVMDDFQKGENYDTLDNLISNVFYTKGDKINFKSDYSLDSTAFILYSSGTTGLPKGVVLTHKNINTTLDILRDVRFYNEPENKTFAILGLLPFFHAYGLLLVFSSINFGKKIILMKKFDGSVFLKTIQDYKISKLNLVPPLLVFLAKSPLVNNYDISHVDTIGCGGASLSKDLIDAVKQRLKVKKIYQGYGMTELTLGVMTMPVDTNKPGSSGKLVPYVSAKVIDLKSGKPLGPMKIGELCFKGGLVMKQYAGNAEETRKTIDSDGWLHTGDIGYYDEEDFFYIVDRLKELIKYKGFQVAPAELEALLLTHPKVDDAAVIGIPDETSGELPLAFIVRKSNENITEKEVRQFVAQHVSSHKWLRGGVEFVNEIPKTASGKIIRNRLKELLKQMPKSKL